MSEPSLFPSTFKPWQTASKKPEPDGETYQRKYDRVRLKGLLEAVFRVMSDGEWRTLAKLKEEIGRGTEASISARLRDLRKEKFGGWTVERKRFGQKTTGLFAYRLVGAK